MKIKVNKHNLELIETPVNELEVNVTKIEFEFDEDMQDMVKEAYFTLNDHSYKVIIQNNECNIPSEVLTQKGNIEIGVVCFEVQDEETIKRYNPSPVYISTWSGSLKEADNTEPITPTDKEQIEQELLNISTQMDNLDIEASKEEHTTTITITRKDGTSYEVEVLDGEKGEQGEPGVPGAVKFIIVQTLPTEDIQTDAIYLVPSEEPTTQDLYLEYMYINNQWELLGQKQIVVDLSNYVQFTDYATSNKGGVVKITDYWGIKTNSAGELSGTTKTYSNYSGWEQGLIISKGTLENVITGKGLVSNTDYANTTTGGVIKTGSDVATGVNASIGKLYAIPITYANYGSLSDYAFISKGTLNNVLNATIGDIGTILDSINGESVGD